MKTDNKLHIAMDLDVTMFKLPLLEETWRYVGGDNRPPSLSCMSTWKITDWKVSDQYKAFILELVKDRQFMCNLTLQPYVLSRVKEWKEMGHTVSVITARDKCLTLGTYEMLNRTFGRGVFEDIIITYNKTKFFDSGVKGKKIDVWIDDNHGVSTIAASKGIDVYLINNEQTPYNHKLKKVEGMRIVKSFGDIDL